jgi:hypothetical protein
MTPIVQRREGADTLRLRLTVSEGHGYPLVVQRRNETYQSQRRPDIYGDKLSFILF